jgi:hypothetical protein
VDLPIIYGEDLRDWSVDAERDQPTRNATIAWTGPMGAAGMRLFHRPYVNPRPDVEVVSLDFISANAGPAPLVVAITVE